MTRRAPSLALLLALTLGTLLPSTVGATDLPVPSSMAAVGDSITQAASSAGALGADAPQNSWSTGTSSSVNSHFLRLRALNGSLVAHNRSVSGAKVADLNAQMQSVVALQPDPGYLTVLIGGNDVCTDTVAQMTSVADFRARFAAAMATITSQSPGTAVYVVSIPDVYKLWDLFDGNFWARFIWATAGICQSMLANPTSTQQADVARRAAVRQRNIDFNTQLAQVCALYSQCRFDNNAAFNTSFVAGDVSGDYFHPSVAGQAKLASVSWAAGYTWTATPPPNAAPTASFSSACVELSCTFTDTSTDADGSIVGRRWSLGDGTQSTETNPTRTYASSGTYPVTLTVTDDDGATASASGSVTVTAPTPTPTPTPMSVDGLSGTTSASRNGWTATVTISVTDGAAGVNGVVVTGTWSAGTGTTSCTTAINGTCTVTASLGKKPPSTKFTVTDLTLSGWVYQQDPDDPTSITVTKP